MNNEKEEEGELFLMLTYKKLWKLLIDHNLSKTEMAKIANISSGTLAKLGKDSFVDSRIINRICDALNCQPGDIMEFQKDNNKDES